MDVNPLVPCKRIPKLSIGQLKIYTLFCQSIKEERVVNREELFQIYKKHVGRGDSEVHVRKGDVIVWEDRPWCDWEWNRNFETWFVYALGALLKKGYLRVMPAIDLSEISESTIVK